MKILVIGSDAKTNALVWKLSQSERNNEICCAPGNPGIASICECVDIKEEEITELCEFALENEIEFTIVNSENAIANGIGNLFEENKLPIFAPTKNAAMISTSRGYGKKFMHKYRIPTPKFAVYDKENLAIDYARKAKYPIVVKNDSYLNKGSAVICQSFNQAKRAIEKCFANLTRNVVIENYVEGRQLTISVITDGYNAVPFPSCVQYKKSLDADGGLNTPGVGAYAPAEFVDYDLEAQIAKEIIFPAIDGLNNDKKTFLGILSADIVIDEKGKLHTIEFNCTLGDPEAQTILPLVEDDLLNVFYSTSSGALGDEYESLNINDLSAVSATLTSGFYPGIFKKGEVIEGIDSIDDDDLFVFQGDTLKNKYFEIVTNGGRPLSLTATASTLSRAHDKLYDSIDLISFKDMKYRKDIAKTQIADNNKIIF